MDAAIMSTILLLLAPSDFLTFLRPCTIHCSNPRHRPLGIHKSQLRLTLLSLSICRVFGFQNDSDIWLGKCEWALVQEQRSMLTPINVPLNGKCVRRLITIVVEMVGDLEKKWMNLFLNEHFYASAFL